MFFSPFVSRLLFHLFFASFPNFSLKNRFFSVVSHHATRLAGRLIYAWLLHYGPIALYIVNRESTAKAQDGQEDDKRRKKFERLGPALKACFNILSLTRARICFETLQKLALTCDHLRRLTEGDVERRRRVKWHHAAAHLAHAQAFWPPLLITTEQQEACNPYLKAMYKASNHKNAPLTIATSLAGRIAARFLQLGLSSAGESPLVSEEIVPCHL